MTMGRNKQAMVVQVVWSASAGAWWVRLRGANGRILMHSEHYDSKGNALRAARSLARWISQATNVKVKEIPS
jgi:uncharacterized protein YegP (UPF0339 family)